MDNYKVTTYSPQDVMCLIAGYQITGWDSLVISPELAVSTMHLGIRGKNTRTMNYNSACKVVITCPQTSDIHQLFTEILTQDMDTAGNGRLSVDINNIAGGIVFSSYDAFIEGHPSMTYDSDIKTYAWEISCLSANRFSSSNEPPTTSIFDRISNKIKTLI